MEGCKEVEEEVEEVEEVEEEVEEVEEEVEEVEEWMNNGGDHRSYLMREPLTPFRGAYTLTANQKTGP
ncbi:hypothetical protein NHX12_007263 [Muraenolepis orangiensis]|uniref:Uncharacterized protein n=1 Tax=Muraenolepis orangiensis TaxID=630683 RepID=A0A9Q0IB07_9TELE|nr:hypothetical protein NHX12_007263 [Muraenolepis orangiensis]